MIPFLFHKNMYYSRVQVRNCIISEISGWNICQGDEWLIKNEEAVKLSFFCLLSTLTIDINIYNYQTRLYICILCRLTKAFEHQYYIYVVTFWPPFALLFETNFRSSFGRVNKGNNKITELRTILQRESQNS
jgi:hypothetical protein